MVVFGSLVGVLTATSVLLRVMQGAPLTADVATNITQPDDRQSVLAVFNTRVPTATGKWKSIFVHHSRTAQGSMGSLGPDGRGSGDHFVIGNGQGALDGEIQFTQRWNHQGSADPAPGEARVNGDCVTVCLVGDFDHAPPTAAQLRRLEHLVQTLQEKLRIPASQVWMLDYAGSTAGVGRYFPINAFQSQLLQ